MATLGLVPTAIRFGLDDLQPFEETIEQRIGNIKIIIRQLSLRPSESFHDYSTLSSHAIIENLKEIPQHFDKKELRQFLTEYFKEGIQSDSDLKKLVKQVEEGDTSPRGRSAFTSLLRKFADRYVERLDSYVKFEVSQFLNSDLPFTMFDEFSLFDRTFSLFLPTISEASRRMQTRVFASHKSRGFRGSKMSLDSFKKSAASVLATCDFAWISYLSSKLYLELKHSKEIKELFQPKQYSFSNLDRDEYERLLGELIKNNFTFREELNRFRLRGVSPRVPRVSVPVYTVWREINSLKVAQA